MFSTGEPEIQPLGSSLRALADSIMENVDVDRLRADVESLPGPRNRLSAEDSMTKAERLVLRRFQEAGWLTERQPLTVTNAFGRLDYGTHGLTLYRWLEGANILAVKEGANSQDAFVILGHYDTVRGTGGADDNTASVAALLELARVLAPYRFGTTVILAATDMEEVGLFGAKALVKKLAKERRVIGAINFETMAYSCHEPGSQRVPKGMSALYPQQIKQISDRRAVGDFTAVIYNGSGTWLARTFAEALGHVAGAHAPLLIRDPNDLPVIGPLLRRAFPSIRNFSRGDHAPFWRKGIATLFITDTANFRSRHYHRPSDTPDTLDYDRLRAIVGATAVTLASRALKMDGGSQFGFGGEE